MAVVFWPQQLITTAVRDDLKQQHYVLLGYRTDAHTLCVVALAHDDRQQQQHTLHGAAVIGHASLVPIDLFDHKRIPPPMPQRRQSRAAVDNHDNHDNHDNAPSLSIAAYIAVDSSKTPPVVVVYDIASNTPQHCTVVLYDTALATRGCLSRCGRALSAHSRFRMPLVQIGAHFDACMAAKKQQQQLQQSKCAKAMRTASETLGLYCILKPSQWLQTATFVFDTLVTAHLPLAVPVVGGKCASDASRCLQLLRCYAHALAKSPQTLHDVYKRTRTDRASDNDVLRAIEAANFLCFAALDVAIGYVLATVVFAHVAAWLQLCDLMPAACLNVLRAHVVWLMGAPAGFKLNAPLASILGNGILLWFDLWEFVLSLVVDKSQSSTTSTGSAALSQALHVAWRFAGATMQLAVLADALAVVTWNSYWVYQYFTKLNMLQLGLFSSLWKLFVGKKNNVLRQRVDSCEYDISQLLLGTLLFTILFFIVTTNMVFFLYFGLVRLSFFALHALLWLPVVGLRALPLASLAYRWWHPTFFVARVRLDARFALAAPTQTLDITDVAAVGMQQRVRPDNDASVRTQIHATVCGGGRESPTDSAEPQAVYFALVPVTASASSLFLRLRAYLQALSTQYALGAVVRSWFFGSRIVPIPLSVLFDYRPPVGSVGLQSSSGVTCEKEKRQSGRQQQQQQEVEDVKKKA